LARPEHTIVEGCFAVRSPPVVVNSVCGVAICGTTGNIRFLSYRFIAAGLYTILYRAGLVSAVSCPSAVNNLFNSVDKQAGMCVCGSTISCHFDVPLSFLNL